MKSLIVSALASALLGLTVQVSAAVLTLTPSAQTAEVGDGVVVQLGISGLGNGMAPSLGVYDIDVAYDPAILAFGEVTLGAELDLFGLGSLSSVSHAAGTINLFELSLDTVGDLADLQAPAFTIATLRFDAIALGTSELTVTLNALGDANGDSIVSQLQNASVTVQPVPLPAGAGLLLSGLLAGAGALRCRRS